MFKRLAGLFRGPQKVELPVLLESREIEKLIPTTESFPVPEWDKVYELIESEYPEQLDQAWLDFAYIWMTRLSYRLEQGYNVQRSPNFLLLSTLTERKARFTLESLEAMRQRILKTLGWEQKDSGYGPHLVLLFHDSTTYLNYVSHFGGDGNTSVSAGKVLTEGYFQITLIQQELWRNEPTLAYLLTHTLLSLEDKHPWWLQFGLSQFFSELYDQGEILPQVMLLESFSERASGFWTKTRMEALWDGSLLSTEDKEVAEDFAQLLTRVILEDVSDVSGFMDEAEASDAGASAVLRYTGRSLDSYVAGILGPADFKPNAPL